MRTSFKLWLALTLCLTGAAFTAGVQAAPAKMGIVIMHGKGGSPTRFVSDLADYLSDKGYLVANLEMPWSGKREYDVDVSGAEDEVEAAMTKLRHQGAQKVFVAGHSQGGLFTLYFGTKHSADGLICIAPGGNVASSLFQEKLGDDVAHAQKLIADGKGNEKASFSDYEGSKGKTSVSTTPAIYFSWFDPEGAMNMVKDIRRLKPETPMLWIVPTHDYPGLKKANLPLFEKLPSNPNTRLYEPSSDHVGSPSASREEILRWTTEISSR